MNEEWRTMTYRGEDFGDAYEVSNFGEIRNIKTLKKRSLNINHEGYLFCVISRGRERKICVKVHRAVAENFVDGDRSLTIDHIDGNKLNNRADNLEFVTAKENVHRSIRKGLWNPHKLNERQVEEVKKLYQLGFSSYKIAPLYNVNATTIQNIISGKTYKVMAEC